MAATQRLILEKDIKMQIIEEPESELSCSCKELLDKPTSFKDLSFVVCFEGSNKIQHFKNENGCQSQNHNPSQPQWPSWVINVPNLQKFVETCVQHTTHFSNLCMLYAESC